MKFCQLFICSISFLSILLVARCDSDTNDKPLEELLGQDNLYGKWYCTGASYNGNPFEAIDSTTILSFDRDNITCKAFEQILGKTSSAYEYKDGKIIVPNRNDPLFDITVFERERLELVLWIRGNEMKSSWARKDKLPSN